MLLVLVVLAAALALGLLGGGQLQRLGALRMRSAGLVPLALGAQLAGTLVGGPAYPVGLGVSAALVALFLSRNRRVRGTGLVLLGLAANALVVALNGAMPVSAAAADRVGVDLSAVAAGLDARHEPATRATVLPALGDVVPVALPLHPEVVSPGDVLVAAGLGQVVVLGLLGSRRRGGRHLRRTRGRWRRRWEAPVAGSSHPTRGGHHGQEGPQAPRPQEVQRQPRASSERVSPRPPAG